jgi:hypothetical protein
VADRGRGKGRGGNPFARTALAAVGGLVVGVIVGFAVAKLGGGPPPTQFVRPMFVVDQAGFGAKPPWMMDKGAIASTSYFPALWAGPLSYEPYSGKVNGFQLNGYALRAKNNTVVLFASGPGEEGDVGAACPKGLHVLQFVRPMLWFYGDNWQVDMSAASAVGLTATTPPWSATINGDAFNGYALFSGNTVLLYIARYNDQPLSIVPNLAGSACPTPAPNPSAPASSPPK